MPILTLTEAAQLAGVSRRTLQRQISRGILSLSTDSNGVRGVEASELLRVYPNARVTGVPNDSVGQMSHSVMCQGATNVQAVAVLEAELRAAQDKIASLESQLVASGEREVWFRQQLESLQQRLLPAPKKPFLDRLVEAWGRFRRQ
jgi:DNA-binding transcriptional MerR regulator